jgi:hypothetical protein
VKRFVLFIQRNQLKVLSFPQTSALQIRSFERQDQISPALNQPISSGRKRTREKAGLTDFVLG